MKNSFDELDIGKYLTKVNVMVGIFLNLPRYKSYVWNDIRPTLIMTDQEGNG